MTLSLPGGFTLDFAPVVVFPFVLDFALDCVLDFALDCVLEVAFDLVLVFALDMAFVFEFDFAGTFPLVSAKPVLGVAACIPANASITAQAKTGAGGDERHARIASTERNAATNSIDDDTIRDSVIASLSEKNKQRTQSRHSIAPRLGPPVRAGELSRKDPLANKTLRIRGLL